MPDRFARGEALAHGFIALLTHALRLLDDVFVLGRRLSFQPEHLSAFASASLNSFSHGAIILILATSGAADDIDARGAITPNRISPGATVPKSCRRAASIAKTNSTPAGFVTGSSP